MISQEPLIHLIPPTLLQNSGLYASVIILYQVSSYFAGCSFSILFYAALKGWHSGGSIQGSFFLIPHSWVFVSITWVQRIYGIYDRCLSVPKFIAPFWTVVYSPCLTDISSCICKSISDYWKLIVIWTKEVTVLMEIKWHIWDIIRSKNK